MIKDTPIHERPQFVIVGFCIGFASCLFFVCLFFFFVPNDHQEEITQLQRKLDQQGRYIVVLEEYARTH